MSTRRRFLQQAGLGAMAFSAAPALALRGNSTRRHPSPHDLEGFARQVEVLPLDDGLRLAVKLHADGWSREELLGGIYVAGARDVEPALGGISHCMMMVPSAKVVAEASPKSEALMPVLFNLADFKNSQSRDQGNGDFKLPRAPAPKMPVEKAPLALQKGLEAFDLAASDRAVVAAAEFEDLEELFEHLWELGVHDFYNIGHKIIFTAHAYRTLKNSGRAISRPVLRSLAYGLVKGANADTVGLEASRERAAAMAKDWAGGVEDPAASRELLQELRSVSPADAPALVEEMLTQGVGPGSLWDGTRLAAAELNLRYPGLLAVHVLTTINAMHYAHNITRRDTTRRLMLFQAAAWTAAYRDYFPVRMGSEGRRLEIDRFQPGPAQTGAAIYATTDLDEAMEGALALVSTPEGTKEFLDVSCRQVIRKGVDSHHYKYAAALIEEHSAMNPEWAPYLLAAGVSYVPGENIPDHSLYRNWKGGRWSG